MRTIEQIERPLLDDRALRVWYLGANSLVLQSRCARLYIDPFLVPAAMHDGLFARREDPPVVAPEVRAFDGILITHEHKDHCNPYTVRALLEARSVPIVAPRTSAEIILDATGQDVASIVRPGDHYSLAGFEIGVRTSGDTVAAQPVAYLIRYHGLELYVAGDLLALPSDGIGAGPKLDAAFLPIAVNPPGRRFYLSPPEWGAIAHALAPTYAVPVHWDVWAEYYCDPNALAEHCPAGNLTIIPVGGYLDIYPPMPESDCPN